MCDRHEDDAPRGGRRRARFEVRGEANHPFTHTLMEVDEGWLRWGEIAGWNIEDARWDLGIVMSCEPGLWSFNSSWCCESSRLYSLYFEEAENRAELKMRITVVE